VCATIGLAQLKKLDGFNTKRRTLAERYFERMPQHPSLVLPSDAPGHIWHMFCVCLDFESVGMTRADVIEVFKKKDIALSIHYPAIHLFNLNRRLGNIPGDFPIAERIGQQTLTLPLFPTMTIDDVDWISAVFHDLLV